jgi:hypothetical protein
MNESRIYSLLLQRRRDCTRQTRADQSTYSTMGKIGKRVGGKRRRKGNEQGDLGSFIK